MTNNEEFALISAWAMDFVRAMKSRPKLLRLLFRIVAGRHAYREFLGLYDALDKAGYDPNMGYKLQRQSYHNERVEDRFIQQERQ
jgi:hypothetical protein